MGHVEGLLKGQSQDVRQPNRLNLSDILPSNTHTSSAFSNIHLPRRTPLDSNSTLLPLTRSPYSYLPLAMLKVAGTQPLTKSPNVCLRLCSISTNNQQPPNIQPHTYTHRPCGSIGRVSVSDAGDCEFESHQGRGSFSFCLFKVGWGWGGVCDRYSGLVMF